MVKKIPSPGDIAHQVKGAAFASLLFLEIALDALLGPHCPNCPGKVRVFPRDQYAHNMKVHRR